VLAPHCHELHAHEIDPRLVPKLRTRFSTTPQVQVIAGDFMDTRPPRTPFAVAGNVPFSRTADIVDWCLRAPALTDATLLTQLEYARKRTGDYGSWTLLTSAAGPGTSGDWSGGSTGAGSVPCRASTPGSYGSSGA
jgi:23S rRNA (adenine-N6)-dimethyltransferase